MGADDVFGFKADKGFDRLIDKSKTAPVVQSIYDIRGVINKIPILFL